MSDGIDLSNAVIIGFGVVGRAVASTLRRRGFDPVVVEDRPTDTARSEAEAMGIELVEAPAPDVLDAMIGRASVLLPSPGVPDRHRCFMAAKLAEVDVRSEFDLARLWDSRPLVSITGTNGKTTVTMMVTDALNRSGRRAAAVGNTDVPLVEAIDDPSVEVFVVEASSFRLGHSHRFQPTVATWINYAPDHLDAHASAAAYEAAKASIWAHLQPDAVAIANADDPVVMRHVPTDGGASTPRRSSKCRVELFSMLDSGADWYCDGETLIGPGGPLVPVGELRRSQPHDLANALAVAATAIAAGAAVEATVDVITSFAGLPHRLEFVGEWDGVAWYNDSKATVPQATEAAVGGFSSVVLIAGGRNKGLALDGLASTVPPVRHVVAIGDAADEVAAVFEGSVPVTARRRHGGRDRCGRGRLSTRRRGSALAWLYLLRLVFQLCRARARLHPTAAQGPIMSTTRSRKSKTRKPNTVSRTPASRTPVSRKPVRPRPLAAPRLPRPRNARCGRRPSGRRRRRRLVRRLAYEAEPPRAGRVRPVASRRAG